MSESKRTPRDRDELAIAEQVLEVASAAASGADIEVAADRTRLALSRFANSGIHQNVADDTLTVRVRLHAAGRTASGSSTLTNTDGLRALVERSVQAVGVAPVDPGWPGLAPVSPAPDVAPVDVAAGDATPSDRAERIRAFVDAAGGLETAGYCRTSHWTGAFVNSAGQSIRGESAEVGMDGIARLAGTDGVARKASSRLADIDGGVLGARAAAKAHAAVDPVELPPGRYEVVLEPTAVSDVLQNLAVYGFNGKMVADGRSFAEVGADQLDPSVTLVDDAPGVGSSHDLDGTPRQRLVLVDRGTTVAVAYDRRTAAEAGAESTGHATGMTSWGAFAAHLGLKPAAGTGHEDFAAEVDGPVAEAATAALVANVERGVLVTDLWYTRVLDTKSLAITGLTRNGVWLIEDGEVTQPLSNFRFTQSYRDALAPGAVLGIGGVAEPQPDSWVSARWTAPALHLASWNFTGGASG
ncbi:TldD/PmbA family protein [soil metagenome]